MNRKECNIVEDLLPIYVNDMCSEDSREFVKEHLAQCSECNEKKRELEKKGEDTRYTIEDKGQNEFVKSVAKKINSGYRKALIRGIVISLSLCMVSGLSYFVLFKFRIDRVPNSQILVERYKTEEGNLVFQISANDGYIGGMLDVYRDNKTNSCYLNIRRPIVKNKSQKSARDMYFYYVDEQSIEKIYIGEPKDNKLIWESGDKVDYISNEDLNRLYEEANDSFYKATDKYYE